jgi:hypothetical protein
MYDHWQERGGRTGRFNRGERGTVSKGDQETDSSSATAGEGTNKLKRAEALGVRIVNPNEFSKILEFFFI